MSSVNKAILIGNLGRDPEVRFTPGGQAVCKFSLATTERWKDKDQQQQEKTVWHNIIVFGKQGESCGQYLTKGRSVYVEGRIDNRSYDDKDGNKKYISEIIASDVRFLGKPADSTGNGSARESASNHPAEEEIPFD